MEIKAGMGLKGENNGKQFPAPGNLAQGLEDQPVTGMKPVEIADGHRTWPGEFFQAAAEFHRLAGGPDRGEG